MKLTTHLQPVPRLISQVVYIPRSHPSYSGTSKLPGHLNLLMQHLIVDSFLKFSISIICHYKMLKQNISGRSIVKVNVYIYSLV
jgi:hypothetical protein